MKQLPFFFILLLPALSLLSCMGNTPGNKAQEGISTRSSDTNASSGDATFSYKIGKVFSGNGADNNFNRAFKHPDNIVHFILTDLDPTLKKAQPQFSFSIAGNGTTVIGKDDMERFSSGNNVKYFANFSIPGGGGGEIPNYYFNSSITVIITSGNSSRLTGTFSGNLLDPDANKVVQLTDGNFDIPIGSSSK